jgi:hypothetical protein
MCEGSIFGTTSLSRMVLEFISIDSFLWCVVVAVALVTRRAKYSNVWFQVWLWSARDYTGLRSTKGLCGHNSRKGSAPYCQAYQFSTSEQSVLVLVSCGTSIVCYPWGRGY